MILEGQHALLTILSYETGKHLLLSLAKYDIDVLSRTLSVAPP